jgi:hypothetical protein
MTSEVKHYARSVKYVFISYLEGVKRYRLQKTKSRWRINIFIINRNVTLDETHVRMKCKDLNTKDLEVEVELEKIHLEVESSIGENGDHKEDGTPPSSSSGRQPIMVFDS